jgi:hypothetical protein
MKKKQTTKRTRKGQSRTQPKKLAKPQEDWVLLQPADDLDEMMETWINYDGPKIGWCFLCNNPIISSNDLIINTATHNFEAGRCLEEQIRADLIKAEKAAGRRSRHSTGTRPDPRPR